MRRLTISPVANAAGGPVNVTVAVGDGTTTTSVVVAVTLTAVNDAPVASTGTASVSMNATVAIPLVATDPEGEAMTYAITTAATSGTGTLVGSTYNFIAPATAGTLSFRWQATDASGAISNIGVTSVVVAEPTPVIAPPVLAVEEDDDKKCGVGSGVILVLGALAVSLGGFGRLLRRRR